MRKFFDFVARGLETAAVNLRRMCAAVGGAVLSVFTSRRASVLVSMLFCGCICAFAQDYNAGITAIGEVTTGIANYIPVVRKLIYAIAAVVAIIGAISVYIAMNNDEQDVKKKIMITVGACLFLIAAATALPAFFGYSNSSTSEAVINFMQFDPIHSVVETALAA